MSLGDLGSAFIDLKIRSASLIGDVRSFGLGTIANEVEQMGDAIQEVGKKAITQGILPLGVAVAANITQWQGLQKQIQETVTLFGSGGVAAAAGQQFDQLREGVSELSAEMGVLEQEIAPALYQAISAGVPRENVFSFLETAQKTAIGGATDVTSAVDLLTTAMNSFEAQGLEADEAADILFRGVARGKTTIEELSASMARVSPVVAAAGVSFEEFVAIIAAMTLSGTQTAEAMTNVRAAMTGLTKPSEDLTAIWQEAGYASADAAISAIGLQGAMQLITDATGGSISEITKLVGGMEATNAILQVTGENADRFNSVLADTSNAAGAAEQAFSLMQETTGRAFGAFTAALDRLGNAGGDLADDFAVPVVQGLTSAIDAVAEFTKDFTEFIRPLADIWRGFVSSILDNEAFRFLAKSLVAAVIGFNALKVAVGVTLVALGGFIKLFTSFFTSGAVTLLLGGFTRQLDLLAGVIDSVGIRLGRLPRIGDTVTRAFGGAGDAVRKFAGFLSPAKLLGAAAAITAIAGAALYAKNKYDEWAESIRITSDGADRLADSLGLVTRDLAQIPTQELTFDISFAEENAELIDELRTLISEGSGQQELLQLGLRWVQLGNTPEEAFEALQRLIRLAGLPIVLEFEAEDLGGGVQSLLDSILGELEFKESRGLILPGGTFLDQRSVEQAKSDAALVGAEIQSALFEGFDQGDYSDLFDVISFLREIENTFGRDSAVAYTFARSIAEGLSGVDVSRFNTSNPIGSLIDQLLEDPSLTANTGRLGTSIRDQVTGAISDGGPIDVPTFRLPPSEDAVNAVRDSMNASAAFAEEAATIGSRIQDIFAEADQYVADTLAGIEASLVAQIPVFSEYTGAAELAFGDWLESQNQFQADLQTVRDNIPDIVDGLPEELQERILSAPISEQVWLASLGKDDLETAIAELTATMDLLPETTETQFGAMSDIIETERDRIINEGMAQLEEDMAEAGGSIAEAWDIRFGEFSENWAVTAEQAAAGVVSSANSYFAANPINMPTLVPTPTGGYRYNNGPTQTVTVNNYAPNTSTAGSIDSAAKRLRVAGAG